MTDQSGAQRVGAHFVQAWNAHDMKAFAALFNEEADFVNVYGEWWTGRARIETEHAAVHSSVFRDSHLSAQDVRIKSLSDDVASLHIRWTLTGVAAPSGTALPDRRGVLVLIVTKSHDQWRIAVGQNTDTIPRP